MLVTFLAMLQVVDPLAVVADQIRPDHDMIDYHIAIRIPDTGTDIVGATTVRYVIRGGAGPLVLDFDPVFTIDSIVPGYGAVMRGRVEDGRLEVPHWGAVGETLEATVHYRGSPSDGLAIQDNVHGRRTAFADNWPNRARHWFPGEDHPSDKARVSYAIEVPAVWKVVANGLLAGVDTLRSGRTVWRWRTDVPIPVYTMVFGAGEMTVTDVMAPGVPPQSLWTFVEDSAFAVDIPYRRVVQIMAQMSHRVGPFPYEKLAHVESSTRFGGMENASAIFYTEGGYASRRMGEGLVAHETAHQWFGDAVTEFDWHHLWLSEGFASYFAPLLNEFMGEPDAFRAGITSAKSRYLSSDIVDRPVIDTSETDLFALLNANNYQKGARILHMLRIEIGDAPFFAGVRDYYATYRDSTALSSDLLAVMERHAERPLRWFFEQWLLQPGYPQLDVVWSYDLGGREADVSIRQVQPEAWGSYVIAVPVSLRFADGSRWESHVLFGSGQREASVKVSNVQTEPVEVVVDSRDDLLLTATVVRR